MSEQIGVCYVLRERRAVGNSVVYHDQKVAERYIMVELLVDGLEA